MGGREQMLPSKGVQSSVYLLFLLLAFLKELSSFTLYSGEDLEEKYFKKSFLNVEVERTDKGLAGSDHWLCPVQ